MTTLADLTSEAILSAGISAASIPDAAEALHQELEDSMERRVRVTR